MPCVYLGPTENPSTYHLYNLATCKFISLQDVIFDKNTYFYKSPPSDLLLEQEVKEHTVPPTDNIKEEEYVFLGDFSIFTGEEVIDTPPMTEVKYTTFTPVDVPTPAAKPTKKHSTEFEMLNAGAHYKEKARVATVYNPESFCEAMKGPKKKKQWPAAIAEHDSLVKIKTWKLVEPPPDCKIVGCKWVFKTKINADGSIKHYRMALQGMFSCSRFLSSAVGGFQ